MYELFDHTADLGFRIIAPDLNTLFAEAAGCLFATILEEPQSVRLETSYEVELAEANQEFLLFDWLKELLSRFDFDHVVLGQFEVHVRSDGLTATVWGEPYDCDRHTLSREVKAITYHELKLQQIGGEWIAEVIVDI